VNGYEKRMRGYRAMGYSVGDYAVPEEGVGDVTVEYDQEALRHFEGDAME